MKNFHDQWRTFLLNEKTEEEQEKTEEEQEKTEEEQEKTKEQEKRDAIEKYEKLTKSKVEPKLKKIITDDEVDVVELLKKLKAMYDKLTKFLGSGLTSIAITTARLTGKMKLSVEQKEDLRLSYRELREKFKGYKGEPTGFAGYIHFLWDEFDKNKNTTLIKGWTKKDTERVVIELAPKYGLKSYIPMGVMAGESGHHPTGIFGQTRRRKGDPGEGIRANSTAYGMGGVTQTSYEAIKHQVGVPHYMIWIPRYGIEATIAMIALKLKTRGDLEAAMRSYAGTKAGGKRKMAAIAKAKEQHALVEAVQPEEIEKIKKEKEELINKFEKLTKTEAGEELEKLTKDEKVDVVELLKQLKIIYDKMTKFLEPAVLASTAAAVAKSATTTGVATAVLPSSEEIRERNKRYFENPEGKSGNGWTSSAEYSKRGFLNAKLGAIPFKGSPAKPIAVHPQWKEDNLVSANIGTSNGAIVHKSVLKSLRTAIEESQTVYGLPLRNNGAYVAKGTEKGLSAHAWGVAIDFEISSANPYNRDGMLDKGDVRIMLKKENYHKFTNSKNSYRAEMGIGKIQTYGEYLQSADATGKRAWPLYAFVAGPMVGRGQTPKNGISTIFKKHGWDWGGDWGGKKDGMHFSISGAG